MSDNIPPDLIERELEARFRIPTEVWTDVFKLLPRRNLVQDISPVCFRFKEICNKNVKNIHVIEKACHLVVLRQIGGGRSRSEPGIGAVGRHLAENDCPLASQFRPIHVWIGEKSQAILRYCPDLFDGCQITLRFHEENKGSTVFLECLGHLEKAKPVQISVDQYEDQQVDLDIWHHPTFQHCTRVVLCYFESSQSAASTLMAESTINIFDWLHHRQPIGMDCDGNAAAADRGQQVRGMIVYYPRQKHIDWLLNRCSQDLQQAHGPADRRPFVFSFEFRQLDADWTGFDQFHRVENKLTGEVLALDRVMNANGDPTYRLRRCLAEEEAQGPVLYAGMFKRDNGFEEFNIDNGTLELTIE